MQAHPPLSTVLPQQRQAARDALDAQVREIIDWHFDPATGCPFWLERAGGLGWDPRREIKGFSDLQRFGGFEDEWLRGGPVQRWVPRGLAGRPVFVFETGGTTGIPKTRIACDDFRTDYELFSAALPDEHFPRGANWLMLGPSGPRRLRLAVEHLAQYRGGICFCVDLDPRWVVKLIQKGWSEHLEAYKHHVIDQAVTILSANHDIRCLFTTPKLLEALALRLESMGTTIRKAGITGIFSGGTEFTPQWNRFAHEELLDGAYMTPTYGNTLMGLAASAPTGPHNNYKIAYYAPQPRAVLDVVDFDNLDRIVDYGETGRIRLTTLTRECFIPGFLERDEGGTRAAVRPLSVGRRQRRQAVSRLRVDHHGGSVLRDGLQGVCSRNSGRVPDSLGRGWGGQDSRAGGPGAVRDCPVRESASRISHPVAGSDR